MNSYSKIILYTSYFSVFIPLVIYLTNIKRLTKPFHIVGILVIISALCDLIGFILLKQRLSTALINNLFFIAQFCLLSYYYYETFFRDKYEEIIIISVVHFFLAFVISTYCFQNMGTEHQNLMWFISSIIIIVYGILFFKKIQKEFQPLYMNGHFWINSAVLLYLFASLWLFAFTSDTLMTTLDPKFAQLLWRFYDINNVIKNILFAVGIHYSLRKYDKYMVLKLVEHLKKPQV
ncbi:MAG TPA: hypothetical protein VFU05_18365 [Cyclobacteriaceae bacterium]|nr:hypothetical protein [Cyclobacteriaceae bacterium]